MLTMYIPNLMKSPQLHTTRVALACDCYKSNLAYITEFKDSENSHIYRRQKKRSKKEKEKKKS